MYNFLFAEIDKRSVKCIQIHKYLHYVPYIIYLQSEEMSSSGVAPCLLARWLSTPVCLATILLAQSSPPSLPSQPGSLTS